VVSCGGQDQSSGDGSGDIAGLRHGIRHWEIGNEVTNARTFGGTAEDYAHHAALAVRPPVVAAGPSCTHQER